MPAVGSLESAIRAAEGFGIVLFWYRARQLVRQEIRHGS
jgi:hypothetical protein